MVSVVVMALLSDGRPSVSIVAAPEAAWRRDPPSAGVGMAPVVHNGEVHSGFDHMTIAVADLDEARHFFALLGFEETAAVVVSGDRMSRYMGIPNWRRTT